MEWVINNWGIGGSETMLTLVEGTRGRTRKFVSEGPLVFFFFFSLYNIGGVSNVLRGKCEKIIFFLNNRGFSKFLGGLWSASAPSCPTPGRDHL